MLDTCSGAFRFSGGDGPDGERQALRLSGSEPDILLAEAVVDLVRGPEGLSAEENTWKEVWEELRAQVLEQRPLGRIAADSGLAGGGARVMLCRITRPEPPLQYAEI